MDIILQREHLHLNLWLMQGWLIGTFNCRELHFSRSLRGVGMLLIPLIIYGQPSSHSTCRARPRFEIVHEFDNPPLTYTSYGGGGQEWSLHLFIGEMISLVKSLLHHNNRNHFPACMENKLVYIGTYNEYTCQGKKHSNL